MGSNEAFKRFYERFEKGQAGHFPYMGTIAAEERLRKDDVYGGELQETFQKRGFTSGALLVANSLTGGTGTGFAPIVPELPLFSPALHSLN